MEMFSKNGKLNIPEDYFKRTKGLIKKDKKPVRNNIVTEAYCPNGCSLIDTENKINGYPGLRIGFKRSNNEGVFILSAIENDWDKIVVSGQLEDGEKDELFCPHCNTKLEKLINCNCKPGADIIVIGLTPKLNYNNAIAFCNVTGCPNGATIESGKIIRRVRLLGEV